MTKYHIEESSGSCSSSIHRGLDFIRSKLDFSDSLLTSSSTATAFVSCAISCEVNTNYLIHMLQSLESQQRSNGGWAPANHSFTNSYSTAWVLLALSSLYSNIRPSAITRAIYYLKRHRSNKSGEIVAETPVLDDIFYYSEHKLYDQPEYYNNYESIITSLVIQSLLAHRVKANDRSIEYGLRNIRNHEGKKRIWTYGQYGRYAFSTYNSLKTLHLCSSCSIEETIITMQYLMSLQRDDGGWNDNLNGKSDVFGTAFVIMTLLLFPNITNSILASRRGIQWLIKQQNDDGSWPMEFTSAELLEILGVSVHPQDLTKFDIIAIGKIIVTASAVWALKLFKSIAGIDIRSQLGKTAPLKKQVENSINDCLEFLHRQRLLGYFEAQHRMSFSGSDYSDQKNLHLGATFQHAIICDALIEAINAGFCVNTNDINKSIDEIVNARCKDIRGGWKYFPSLLDLPPDADDLGQILQVLVRSGYLDVAELCDDAIGLLFEQNIHSDGSFETWIVDRAHASAKNSMILRAIDTKWGKGPDVEVMANMLYGLYLYNYAYYRNIINKGVEFLIRKQRAEGYWPSTWYYGNFYGTYVCTRVLCATRRPPQDTRKHGCLRKVMRFLVNSQTKRGGWGTVRENPTDTALGIMTVIELMRSGIKIESKILKSAVSLLLTFQDVDGRWYGSDFIKMDTTRALMSAIDSTHKREPIVLTYRSDTITSALCLKSLCQAHRCLLRFRR